MRVPLHFDSLTVIVWIALYVAKKHTIQRSNFVHLSPPLKQGAYYLKPNMIRATVFIQKIMLSFIGHKEISFTRVKTFLKVPDCCLEHIGRTVSENNQGYQLTILH